MVSDLAMDAPARRAQASAEPTTLPFAGPLVDFGGAVLASYGQVLFSRGPASALLVLAATFVVPSVGAVGLLGVLLALGGATLLGLDRELIRSGALGYNALLVFLMVGATLAPSPAFWALAAVLACLVVLCHVALSSAMGFHLRLPVLSLPFVLVGWLALLSVPFIKGMEHRGRLAALDLPAFPGPQIIDDLLRSLGALFFQPCWTAGALVLLALLLFSRIATLHALVGFAVAVFADAWLFTFPADFLHLYVGFNFVMTAVALGGIYYVPGPASLLLAAGGSLATGLISVGMIRLLQPLGLPVLAIPFNITVLLALYALARRGLDAQPRPVDFLAGSPEDNLNHWRSRVARFRSKLPVRLQLPFRGEWVCTQGNDGEHTHQGPWRHGLDFEVIGADGGRFEGGGEGLDCWHCYRLPVVSPAAGTVVRVVDGLPDNPVGEVDTVNNWGNLVVLQHAPGLYSLLAHLSPGSIAVKEGATVLPGELLGLVGSSGRAPAPHLHFQLQATPSVGDPTLPVEFHGVVRGGAEVLAQHLPTKGERLRNVQREAGLARALALPPGQRLRVRVRSESGERIEQLISEIDPLGKRSLYSPSRDARLWFENRDDFFVVYDHSGPRDGALFVLYAALARVPLEDGGGLRWEDHLNPRRLGSTVLAWLRDALAAVLSPPDQLLDYRSQRRGELLIIEGEGPGRGGQRPVSCEARLRIGVGVEAASVQIGEQRVSLELLSP